MTEEDQHLDRKSLRLVSGRNADWEALARDCVAFANARGGRLLIGVEDGASEPPPGQTIPAGLPDRLRRRLGELTVNVQVVPQVATASNGGAFIELGILRAGSVASTSDGRYFLRVGDSCQPVVGDDVLRLADERPGLSWEAMTSLRIPRQAADRSKVAALIAGIGASDRVKDSVKEKTPEELLTHYALADADLLTNLGILLVGTTHDRGRLGTAPVIQFLKYDAAERKINKLVWDDYALSPLELVDAIWSGVPDFRESYELAEGLFRRTVPAFDEMVIRELLVNALVHRPYTQRGDIFLNLRPTCLEVVNPGRLPLGVTPRSILHASRRRNDGLARIFHDLKLMEREGSGFDLLYDRLLSSGRQAPTVAEKDDSVAVTVQRQILRPEVLGLLEAADSRFQLSQRERITLARLAQSDGMTAADLGRDLAVTSPDELAPWLGRLQAFGLVDTSGRTRAMRYFVVPDWLRGARLDGRTTQARISPHRLRALILEDLTRYPDSASTEINRRIGAEISTKTVKRTLDALFREGRVSYHGERRWRRYRLVERPDTG